MNLGFSNPTAKDVKTFVFFAMNKPSLMPLESAITVASIEFNLNKQSVRAMLYKGIDSTKLPVIKSLTIH
jgi:hypothetical protein